MAELKEQEAEPLPVVKIPKRSRTASSAAGAGCRRPPPKRRLFYKFWRGETYWYVNSRGMLSGQDTITWSQGGKMPDHRIRNSYPFIASVVQAKVSPATQRVPGYEVVPSTTEPQDAQAARLSEKVALYGYDEWRIRRSTVQVVEHALVGGEGFAYERTLLDIGETFENTSAPASARE